MNGLSLQSRLAPIWSRVRPMLPLTPLRRSLASIANAVARPIAARCVAETPSLAIFDDAFPNRLSAFRVVEFNEYLRRFPDSLVYTTHRVKWPGRANTFAELQRDYAIHYPEFAPRIVPFSLYRNVVPQVFYCVFLNNAYEFVPIFERAQRPFVMTLYPGGGFALNDAESDRKLRRVFRSPYFRGVVTTQSVTRDYLLDKTLVPESKIHHLFGGFLPNHFLATECSTRLANDGLRGFNVCFVAAKYTPQGRDKGYPTFIQAARLLLRHRSDVRFHVVGNFGPDDLDVSDIASQITFYGLQSTEFFPGFYSQMDVIVSPNEPNLISPGAFDGFPTGCCAEAAVCGVAIMCTDPLNLNPGWKDGEEIVIVPPDAPFIARRLDELFHDLPRLLKLKDGCRKAVVNAAGLDKQMRPRIDLLTSLIIST